MPEIKRTKPTFDQIRSRGYDKARIDVDKLVISLMQASASRHVTAESFNAGLLAAKDRRISIPTFQRAFWRLLEKGVLHRVSVLGEGNYIQHFYELADQPRHVHFYCTTCKRFEEIFDAALIALHDRALTQHGLTAAAGSDNALRGTCAACLWQRAAAPPDPHADP